jgi:NADPH2:quinone reductase
MVKTTSAVRFEHHGDPDVLKMQDFELAPPAAGELQIEHEAIGVNYIDIYHRKGVYAPPLPLPAGLGMKVSGWYVPWGAGSMTSQLETVWPMSAVRRMLTARPATCLRGVP